MTQLTQEHFDEVMKGLATKGDLTVLRDDLTAHIDATIIGVRNDISGLRAEMNVRLDAMLELLDMRNRVETLERQVAELQAK